MVSELEGGIATERKSLDRMSRRVMLLDDPPVLSCPVLVVSVSIALHLSCFVTLGAMLFLSLQRYSLQYWYFKCMSSLCSPVKRLCNWEIVSMLSEDNIKDSCRLLAPWTSGNSMMARVIWQKGTKDWKKWEAHLLFLVVRASGVQLAL